MNSMWKRSFALLLSLVMVFGMVPVNAFAEETECSHSYEATVTDPTCTAVGYTTYTCACGDTYTADEVAATGHSYADGFCSVCGAEEHTHSYEAVVTAPTCTVAGFTTYTCACGDTYTADEVAATGHSYADGVCSVCGAAEVKACSVDENCEAETHDAECPMGPCTQTEGCGLAKSHVELGVPCTGAAVFVATSTLTNAYTSENAYWGECGGNASESFVFKFYHDNTYMGYTSLNNVGGIIDGDVYVTWNMLLDVASNTDEYWTMAWDGAAPTLTMQPNRVEHWVDGEKAAECAIEPNASDSIFPVVATVADADGKILKYVTNNGGNTLNKALAEAKSGDVVVLTRDVTLTETAVVADGVTLNGNGKMINGTINVSGNLTIEGETTVAGFGLAEYDCVITIGPEASLTVTGSRVGISYGSVFNITGKVDNAKTTDKDAITPSVNFVKGTSFNGNGSNNQFNVTNAYVILGDSSSKNSGATGIFNFNFTNSIVDFTNTLKTYEPTVAGLDPTFNFNFTNSKVNIASHMELWRTKNNMVLDNTDFTVGSAFAHAGTLTVKNGSRMTVKYPVMSSHGGNTGTINIENATFELVDANENWVNDGTIKLTAKGKLIINDFTNGTAGEIVINANGYDTGDVVVERPTGAIDLPRISVTGFAGAACAVEDNKVVLTVPVAKVGENFYTNLSDALNNAGSDQTVTLLKDITIDKKWDTRYDAKIINPITIDGDGHTVKFTGEINDGFNFLAAFRFTNSATVKDLTIDMSEAISVFNKRFSAIASNSDLTVTGCTFIGSTTYTSARAIIYGENSGNPVDQQDVTVTNSTFINWGYGVVDNMSGKLDSKTVSITGNTFTKSKVQISAADTIIFNNNTVTGAPVSITTYTQPARLDVTANGNTLDTAKENEICTAAIIDAQPEFTKTVVAKIGDKTYGTLRGAVMAYQNDDVIELQQDITFNETVGLTVAEGKVAVVDLNGKTLTMTDSLTFLASGTLTITGNGVVEGTLTKADAAKLGVSGGKFSENPSAFVLAGYKATNPDGENPYYVVTKQTTEEVVDKVSEGNVTSSVSNKVSEEDKAAANTAASNNAEANKDLADGLLTNVDEELIADAAEELAANGNADVDLKLGLKIEILEITTNEQNEQTVVVDVTPVLQAVKDGEVIDSAPINKLEQRIPVKIYVGGIIPAGTRYVNLKHEHEGVVTDKGDFMIVDGYITYSTNLFSEIILTKAGNEIVAEIGTGEEAKPYSTLKGAVEAANGNKTVYLKKSLNDVALDVDGNVTATIDLNGHTLTAKDGEFAINNKSGSTLTIKDSSKNGTGKIVGSGAVQNAGTLIIESGKFVGSNDALHNTGSMTIKKADVQGGNRAIHAAGGTVTVNGGNFSADNGEAVVYATGTGTKVAVNGGNFTHKKQTGTKAAFGPEKAPIEATGGNYNADPDAFCKVNYVTVLNSANNTWNVAKIDVWVYQDNAVDITHYRNTDGDMTLVCNGDLDKCTKIEIKKDNWVKVLYNGIALTPEEKLNWDIKSGSTELTLKKKFLNNLSDGDFKVVFTYKDGDVAERTIKVRTAVTYVADKTNPKTGDEIALPMFVMFSTAAALAVLVMGKKKYF